MTYSRVAIVTGANKGIGLAIVRQLALQYPKSPYNNGPLRIYLAARDATRGAEAVQATTQHPQLKASKALAADGGPAEIRPARLDITSRDSIHAFAAFLHREHPDGVDFVINNAGVGLSGADAAVARQTLACNYHGTLAATQALLPLVRDGGRVVNVSSAAGHLGEYAPGLRARFRGARGVEDVSLLMDEFVQAVADGECEQRGWPSAPYAVSKAGVTGMTKVVAERQKDLGSKVLINACCPGWVQTDLTKGSGPKTPDEGAQTPVMLALEDIGGRTGLFWLNEKVLDW